MPNLTIVSLTHGGLDGIDPQASRHFQCGGAYKAFQACIDKRDRCTSGHRVHREDTGGQNYRTLFAKMILRDFSIFWA